jgi:hypothetical protein
MTDTLILIGYGSAMILGFAAVGTILYYSFSRGNRYQYSIKPQVEMEVEEMENAG